MAYVARTIKDRVAVGDDVFIVEDLGNNKIKLTPAPTHVSEPGTPVNKALLQPIENELASLSTNKVDKVAGKGLSTNDFTTPLKNKLDGVETGAQVNRAIATKAQAEAGTDNTTDMTPLRVKEAILGISRWVRGSRFVVGSAAAGYTTTDVDFLCNGTNDADVINDALSSTPSSGGEVVLLDGYYQLYDVIVVPSGATLRGSGVGTYIVGKSTSLQRLIDVEGSSARLRSLRLQTNGVTVMGHGVTLEDLTIYDAWAGVGVEGDMCSIVNCRFVSTSTGVVVHSDNCIISHNLFDSADSGDYSGGVFVQGGWVIVTNNIIKTDPTASQRYSIQLNNSSKKCLVSGNLLHGISVSNSGTDNNVVNNVV